MIPRTHPIWQVEDWQNDLRNVITDPDELLSLLKLKQEDVGYSTHADQQFALKVPRSFVSRMRVGDPEDPLLLQVLASQNELIETGGYVKDPLVETGESNPQPGIIHKYQGRVLLIVSGSCMVNCRYCFRRHFPYSENQNSRSQWQQALGYVRDDSSISEVILSGGDPLILNDAHLAELVDQISAIAHVKRLRIHSRVPVVLPNRITSRFLDTVCRQSLQTVMVIHANHPNEIDHNVARSMQLMANRGITLLNQSVLLRKVNDNSEALITLSERLFSVGVLPYYIHLLDKVEGAAHFAVDEHRARTLFAEISANLPGYLVPQLVREEPEASAKTRMNALL